MCRKSTGLDFSEVRERERVKSIRKHGTFEEDINDPVKIKGALDILVESVHSSLLKQRFLFKTVTLIICFEDFSTYTRSKTVPTWIADIFIIKKTVL